MKIRPIIAASVLLAAFAASALPVSATQESAAAAIEAGNKIAAENLIDIQSDEAAIALNIVNSVNNGSIPNIIYNDDASIRTIQGAVTGNVIRNEKDAAAALKNVAALFGIQDFDKELVFDSANGEDFIAYAFQQDYQGVKVLSGYLTLVVDAATKKAVYLNNTFAADLDLDITPVITAEQAGRIAANELAVTDCDAPELVISQSETGKYYLAWSVHNDTVGVIIDAKDGEVMQNITPNGYTAAATYTYNDSVANPITKKKTFTINYEGYYNGSYDCGYRLHDVNSDNTKSRNIWVLADENCNDYNMTVLWNTYGESYMRSHPTLFETQYKSWLEQYVAKHDYSYNWASDERSKIQIGVAYQFEKVYDFYKNVFNRKGVDGNGSALVVNAMNRGGSLSSPYGNFIGIGYSIDYSVSPSKITSDGRALDCCAHEYTHCTSNWIVKWNLSSQSGETGCLHEGYADIMGEYCEGYTTGTYNWKVGTDVYAPGYRDLTYMGTGPYNGQLYRYTTASQMASTECHSGSTILSHCAYRMKKYGIPNALGRNIWYSSLSFLPTGANVAKFTDARNAAIYVGEYLTNQYTTNATTRLQYKSYIRMAFNAVNVRVSSEKIGDVDRNGVVNSADAAKLSQFLVGNASLDVIARACADVNMDGKITTADRDLIH
ncbi:MAG: M4 family metallopeptidase [Oscillospiraceae bacterium]|nr:M4 family metallopeptidase [Oscillospiraceae bacterium]MCR4761726.1 M4 family metallopeptidase [Oscillospiraceae bacterium]